MKDVPSQSLQQRLKDLTKALDEARDPTNQKQFPAFKKKGEDDSFRYPQHVKLDQQRSRVFLPKLGWVRYINSQEVTGKLKNATLSLDAGRWYISIQTERSKQENESCCWQELTWVFWLPQESPSFTAGRTSIDV